MAHSSLNQSKSMRGFASMSAEQRQRIASKGGKSVPDSKRSFSMRRDLASKAGRKGGLASRGNRQMTDAG
jgi:uncharacterized protein